MAASGIAMETHVSTVGDYNGYDAMDGSGGEGYHGYGTSFSIRPFKDHQDYQDVTVCVQSLIHAFEREQESCESPESDSVLSGNYSNPNLIPGSPYSADSAKGDEGSADYEEEFISTCAPQPSSGPVSDAEEGDQVQGGMCGNIIKSEYYVVDNHQMAAQEQASPRKSMLKWKGVENNHNNNRRYNNRNNSPHLRMSPQFDSDGNQIMTMGTYQIRNNKYDQMNPISSEL